MSENNGANPGPPFAFIGTEFSLLPYTGVLESLELNAVQQAANNLMLGPLFRKIKDDFRDWAKQAEPGWIMRAPEVNLNIIRLAAVAPVAVCMSEEGRQRMEAAEPAADRLRISTD